MSHRPRPMSRSNTMSEDAQIMTQVWHGLVDTLRQLPPMNPGTRIQIEDDRPPTRPTTAIQSEKQHLDEALEKIKVLIEMRRNEEKDAEAAYNLSHASIPSVQISTPSSAGGIKRKRRTSLSYSASPAPTMPNSADSMLTSVPSPLPGRGGTPSGASLLGNSNKRKEMVSDQLPLHKGRRAVYKLPATADNEEDNWILVTIEHSLHGDPTKYRVLDADIDDNSEQTFYNTTLKSLIPLPDPTVPNHLSTHPNNLETFAPDTQVLALYPDTTAFYRATVVSPPARVGAGKLDLKAKRDMYRLKFVDDGDDVKEVHRYNVIKNPH